MAYMPMNTSNVIEGDKSENDDSLIVSHPITAIVSAPQGSRPNCSDTNHSVTDTTPLRVPHLFWHCSSSGPTNDFPITFNALIDDGSHTVLIHDDFANSLGLCHRNKLSKPEHVELTMASDGKKIVLELNEWVKLQLYNTKSWWTLKTVCAIVAPGLCSPVILRLPFLSHNHIVIDHHAHTVINKESGFGLLNPTPPPTPLQPKMKLKDFFLQLQEDRKLMVAELKWICADRL